ncbi:predicted protein [Plenodomus lingam JN3]|uniref:Predicted protein n=1 Tax=Leptosphaeria maculans (strain JN3 / isolate v23.1.3 / race Av1-4-5-6-7-8) TaxID=985895 RepID=E4ZMA4_LEPMJ|nr:predicted protein [Plenodomus lingam JN3]CBX92453.1 predicted protein [Plenodomus lingam JN3]
MLYAVNSSFSEIPYNASNPQKKTAAQLGRFQSRFLFA